MSICIAHYANTPLMR